METRKFRQLALAFILMLLYANHLNAAVVVTPANNGSCLALSPGAFTTMSNIVVTEGLTGDIGAGAGITFILTAPAGFEFNAGSGNVVFTAGRDISSAALAVTPTTITVTLNIATNTNLDAFRIRNVGIRALVANATGQILRTVAGGTAVITGNIPGGGTNHGSLSATGSGATFSTIAAGSWSDASIWNTGTVPSCTDNVEINHQINADISSSLNNLTINTGGNLISDVAVSVSGNFAMNGTGIYTHNNTNAAATTIFGGSEVFASTSKIIVSRWSNFAVPLATGVTGNFGEIEINTSGTWHQDGLFSPDRIKNTLTINSGLLIMDDGTGMTTSLTLQDVVVTGTGRIQVQTGVPRNLNFATGNFTDISTSTGLSAVVYLATGDLNWTINGDLYLNHRFSIIEGSTVANTGDVTVDVTGDFTVAGRIFDGMKRVTGSFTMDVAGSTLITGTPTSVMFKDYFTGDLQFTSGSMTVNAPSNIYFLGTHTTVGAADVIINGDLTLTGNTTRLYMAVNGANTNDVSLIVTNDFTVTGSQMYTALTSGNVTVQVGRNYTQTGATSEFYGQRSTSSTLTTAFNVAGSAFISDGLFIQSRNRGTISSDIVEVFSLQNASYYGMNNTSMGNNGIASLDCADLNIDGSTFILHQGYVTDNRIVAVNIDNDLNINFTSASQTVMFVARNSDNTTQLNLNIGDNFIVAGSADGLFCSSVSAGNEIINIGGDMLINAGRVRFNSYENYSARGHDVTGTIGGSFILAGGNMAFSGQRGVINWTINGDYDQTAGYAVYKWFSPGVTNINVLGNYNLSNANAIFYSKTSTAIADPVTLTVDGSANLENAVVMFDSCLTSTATHRLIFRGSSVTYGENVTFDHAAHLSNRLYFGNITYDRAGTITLRRNSPIFDIRQTKQNITAGTEVDFSSSPFDLMISSHISSLAATHTTLTIDGTLDMGLRMITARSQPNYFSSLDLNSGARLRTAHTGGLYSGTAANSCIYPLVSGSLRMNFYLDINSTVEYNGVDNQRLTGTGIGLAVTDNHRYGDIEIDFNGIPDVEFVYIGSGDSANIRSALILTNGELNLDTDHDMTGGGQQLHLQNGATISRTNGYIRSETYDGSARVRWKIDNNGSYVIPFGYNSTTYVPLTFQLTSGNAGNSTFTTNRVAADNTPYPPTITHVNDLIGADNSGNTVDRFWSLDVPGSVTADLTFTFAPSEATGIVSPRAQLWEPVSTGWFPPSPSQSNPTAITTQITGVTNFNNWWTLTPPSTPLPVELLSFDARAQGTQVILNWATASEVNNDYFTVERSFDGTEFSPIAQVEGAGTTSSLNSYSALDKTPRFGINYYRLKQTDFDGHQTVSEIKMVNFKDKKSVQIYPNPVVGHVITVSTGSVDESITSISIFDMAGKMVLKQQYAQGSQSEKSTRFDLGSDLGKGVYLVEVESPSGPMRERIVIQ